MERKKPSPSPAQEVRASRARTAHARKEEGEGHQKIKREGVSSGATLLNCCLTDDPFVGLVDGKVVNVIGDSSSGKTLLMLTAMAEMCRDPRFDEYDLILDDAEDALAFDVGQLFGSRLAARLNTEFRSATIEEFYGHIKSRLKDKKPFIYVLDSLDALSCNEEQEHAEKYAEGKEVGGSYKMGKAKLLSEILRVITGDIADTRSMLVIISQIRDNLDPMSFQKKTRSGGRALKFYCTHEVWLTLGQKIKKKERQVGVDTIAKVTKNKITGKVRECKFSIFYDYGVDDIGSMVDFLVESGAWTKTGQTIDTHWDGVKGTRDKLIREIEDNGWEVELRQLVGATWGSIEESIRLNRKARFE